MNRRDLLAMTAFAALGTMMAEAQQTDPSAAGPDGKLSKSIVFSYDKLPVKHNDNGGTSRHVVSGTLVTGEFIEVHMTELPAGKMPHPAHKHSHSELLMIRQGDLQFINNGAPEKVGPGDVVFTAGHVLHGLKNVGTTMASYFVVAVGVQKEE